MKWSQNQTLKQADLDLSFMKVGNIKAMKFLTIFFKLDCPSSPPACLKLIYFVKIIPFAKAQTRPLSKPKKS